MLVAPAAAAALLAPSLAGLRTLAGGDHLVYWHPFMTFFRTHWAADGVIPFWIPNLFAGMPLPESLGPSFFYPTDVLCWGTGLPVRLFYAWDAWLHLVIASLGVHVLARRQGARDAAAAFAACAYVFGGYLQVQMLAGTQPYLRAACWLPWMFALLTGSDGGPARIRPVPFGLIAGLLLLGQSFQILAFLSLMVLLGAALHAKDSGSGRRLRQAIVAIVLAAALGAIALLPAVEYFRLSFRHLASEVWMRMEYVTWPQLVALVFPDAFGDGVRAKYLGLVPVVLAIAGLAAGWRRSWRWAVLIAAALLLSLGPQTPAGAWLGAAPLFRGMRTASHWIVFVQLGVSVLAGLGAEAACHAAGRWRRVPAWAVATGLIVITLLDAGGPARPHPRQLDAAAMGKNEASVLTLLTRGGTAPFRIYSEEPHVLLNTRIGDVLEWTTGYHGVILENFGRLFDAATACGRIDEAMAVLGATYAVTKEPRTASGLVPLRQFQGQDGNPWWLSRMDRALPRVFIPRDVRSDPDGAAALTALCAGRLATTRLAFVAAPTAGLPAGPGAGTAVRRPGTGPNGVEAAVDLRTRSVVVFDEVAYPAWKGLVDGARTPVFRADLLLRAVVVPPGRHVVRLVYDSFWFKIGLWVSLLAWTGLAASLVPAGPRTPVY